MKMTEAIEEARKSGDWPVTGHEPTSVNVRFVSADDEDDETQLDLYGDTPEKREEELEELWGSLYEELEAAPDAVTGVEALGYIAS